MLEHFQGVELTLILDGYAALVELLRIKSIHCTQPEKRNSNDQLDGCLVVLDSVFDFLTPNLLGG